MKPSVMIVEDDESLGETLRERLVKEGYKVFWSKTAADSKIVFLEKKPNLVILDLRLPDENGFHVAEFIKKESKDTPFLFLTAQAGAQERLKGFELGAVEFIPKPFHLKELLIRLERVIQISQKPFGKKWRSGSLEIHLDSFAVKSPGGELIPLSKRDCALLELLISEPNHVWSRNEILDQIVGEDAFPTQRTIDNAIVRLREALGESSIRNVRGVGYQWIAPLSPLN
ncbi:response regulator transcription factor [Leptospira ilyithenensis]|uniref:DNA-binding response regulator n=1 Tax=Leptospira ilyithenensis TaxID=2484901 RepID=A0A4R9LTD0_9LEPT|nr:response regulator transcription factor [Leptospira ilyithenensis]TGN11996.1 DNA-binding response regulator [Leptospira ilyithenensis]